MPVFPKLTLQQAIDRFPPFICFSLTKMRREPLSNKQKKYRAFLRGKYMWTPNPNSYRRITPVEMSKRTGIVSRKISRIAGRISWDGVKVSDMLKFMNACNIDLRHIWRTGERVRRMAHRKQPWAHLTKLQLKTFLALSRRHKLFMQAKAAHSPPSEKSTRSHPQPECHPHSQ